MEGKGGRNRGESDREEKWDGERERRRREGRKRGMERERVGDDIGVSLQLLNETREGGVGVRGKIKKLNFLRPA